MIRELDLLLERRVYGVARRVLRRSGSVMAYRSPLAAIVRLAVVYALSAAALALMLPVLAGVAVWCSTWPMGRRRPLRQVR